MLRHATALRTHPGNLWTKSLPYRIGSRVSGQRPPLCDSIWARRTSAKPAFLDMPISLSPCASSDTSSSPLGKKAVSPPFSTGARKCSAP